MITVAMIMTLALDFPRYYGLIKLELLFLLNVPIFSLSRHKTVTR